MTILRYRLAQTVLKLNNFLKKPARIKETFSWKSMHNLILNNDYYTPQKVSFPS